MECPRTLTAPLGMLRQRLGAKFGDRLREVRMFGSYARGDAHEDSDVDVLIVIDGLADLEIGAVADEATAIMLETGLPLSPLPMSTERREGLRSAERLLSQVLDDEGILVD